MATVPTVSSRWIPEDDFLLKNALEAGASLEALAKGAIQFSRRYTLQELQERWHSLLYDPDISAQFCAHIYELEISGFNPAPKLNRSDNNTTGNKEVSKKRKYESIRRKYYSMKKKIRNEFFSNSDLGFFEHNPHEFNEHGAEFQNQAILDGNNPLGRNCMIGDSLSDQLMLQEDDLDILRHAFPGTIRDTSGESNGIVGRYGFDENVTSSLGEGGNNILDVTIKNRKSSIDENPHSSFQTIGYASEQPHLRHWRTLQDVSSPSAPAQVVEDMIPDDVEGKENSSSVYTGEFADPDSLLNLSNEDEMLLVDVDEKHAENKYCIDIVDSVTQESNKDDHEKDIPKPELEAVTLSEACSEPAPTANALVSEVDVPSKSTSCSDLTELCHGKIICTLNTEDPEIPCNDDIFLLIHPSTSFGSFATQPNSTVPVNACPPAHLKDNERGAKFSTKGKELRSAHTLGGAAKTEIHDSRSQAMLHGYANKTRGESSKARSLYAIPRPCTSSLAEKEVAGVDMKVGDNPARIIRSMEAGAARSPLPESLDDSASDQDESQIDDDVPYFSDVEAMILEMDLDPYDQDSHITRQVPSYQYDDTRRTIIRLEQAARSCLQRAMTSQGALAIFYGRHLRSYIRKPEVLLGRSTDDFDVDIDLRKEGRANKISRRQATIKMEADGSFSIKHLGKSSLSVNGMTIAPGQSTNLSSGCLIEIKGMSFVFEINQGYVRKHLGDFCLKNKGKMGKFDWSAEDEP